MGIPTQTAQPKHHPNFQLTGALLRLQITQTFSSNKGSASKSAFGPLTGTSELIIRLSAVRDSASESSGEADEEGELNSVAPAASSRSEESPFAGSASRTLGEAELVTVGILFFSGEPQ